MTADPTLPARLAALGFGLEQAVAWAEGVE